MAGLLEFRVLSVLRRRENYLRYKDHVKVDLFKSPELQLIYKTIKRFHDSNDIPILSIRDLRMLLERKIPADEVTDLLPVLRKIKEANTKDDAIVRDSIVKFAQGQLIRETVSNILYALEHDIESIDLEELRGNIDEAISLGSTTVERDYEYFHDHEERLEDARGPLFFPTRISKDLDNYLGGGLCPGELGTILAPPGVGKTLALANIGTGALRLGKRVLHFTLEIKARVVSRRYDLCLCKRTFEELREDPGTLETELERVKKLGAKLTVKDYTYQRLTLGELEALLKRYQSGPQPFDMVIIDYAALIKPPKGYKDKRNEIANIYLELRNLAGAFNIPIWTASQANRRAIGKRVVGLEDIAESIDIANISDFVLGLCQTIEEKEELMMRVFIAKTRAHSKNHIVPLICDPDRMLLKSYKKEEVEDAPNRNRPRNDSNWDRVVSKKRSTTSSSSGEGV